ncbi:hypothetical protein [Streptomyces sp. H51]|uniref:hypothetical protein n=1 Tax=Streptomyces sp. H51 TaxID=3111770 RepID=UPI002D790E97|nr:hypothetical protein [Streptomyces sp. H51]
MARPAEADTAIVTPTDRRPAKCAGQGPADRAMGFRLHRIFPSFPTHGGWESMAVHVVLRYGSRADAEALLPVFLDAPAQRDHLVPVFARHGIDTFAALLGHRTDRDWLGLRMAPTRRRAARRCAASSSPGRRRPSTTP